MVEIGRRLAHAMLSEIGGLDAVLQAYGRKPMPCKVLDPFAGAGTTGLAALRHGRDAVLIELSSEYCKIMERRLAD